MDINTDTKVLCPHCGKEVYLFSGLETILYLNSLPEERFICPKCGEKSTKLKIVKLKNSDRKECKA